MRDYGGQPSVPHKHGMAPVSTRIICTQQANHEKWAAALDMFWIHWHIRDTPPLPRKAVHAERTRHPCHNAGYEQVLWRSVGAAALAGMCSHR